jgi:hypothetical protein
MIAAALPRKRTLGTTWVSDYLGSFLISCIVPLIGGFTLGAQWETIDPLTLFIAILGFGVIWLVLWHMLVHQVDLGGGGGNYF